MCANWSRCSGRASAFAPASSSTDGPRLAGIGTAIAGRSTPGRRRSSSKPAASIAPVFPAETTTSASPAATARQAATSELSGFERTASAGFSSHPDHIGRLDVLEPGRVERSRAEQDRLQRRRRCFERAGDDIVGAAIAAHRVDGDANHGRLRSVDAERLDLAARDSVLQFGQTWCGPRRLATVRAGVHARRLDAVLRTALVAPGLGRLPFRDCHERLRSLPHACYSWSRSCDSAAQRESPVSSSCTCGSSFRFLPQTGQRPAQSEPAEDLLRQPEHDRVASPGGEVELLVVEVRARKLLVVRVGRLVLARRDRHVQDRVLEAAEAGPVQRARGSASSKTRARRGLVIVSSAGTGSGTAR